MENYTSRFKYLAFFVLIGALGINYFLAKLGPENDFSIYRTKANEDKFTRGQIHYLSMDAGMSDCWNDTVKKLVFLGCPFISKNPKVEFELIFILTACFCESTGAGPITCSITEKANTTKKYIKTLSKCASKKCYTKFGHDGYDTISTRMHELCYFIEEEMKVDNSMIKCCELDELVQLRSIVNGDRAEEFYPRLKYMDAIIHNKILSHQESEFDWFGFGTFEERFWRIWDDIKFRLRVGKYRNVKRY